MKSGRHTFSRNVFCSASAFAALLAAGALPTAAQNSPSGANVAARKLTPPKGLDPELEAAIKGAPAASVWPNSDYARILDTGDVTIKSDGTIVAEYRESYKLFNERARHLAEVAIPYNSSYQSVKIVRAQTVKKDGTVLTVKPDDIRTSSPFSDYLMYDDAMSVGFSMPGIEDDCVIDYTYQMITHPLLLPGQFWTHWYFSGLEPVRGSKYVVHAPADKDIKYKVYNDANVKPTIETSKDGRTKTYTWEMHDIKPLDLEPAMPAVRDVRIWMEASSIPSWQDIAKWFWELQKPQAVATDSMRQTVKTLTANKTSDDDKARAIYDWVANKTRYVGLEFGISAYKPHAAGEVYDKLYGDCKDKATLLVTMLGLAGIKAHPVLLSAGERHPVASELPSLDVFNHCIALAEVGGKEVWLDGTAETCAYGDIPEADRGVQAFVVKDGTGEFKTIPRYQTVENGLDMTTQVALNSDGSAGIQNQMNWIGGSGQSWRATIRGISPDQRKLMVQRVAQSFSAGATLKDYNLPDGTDKNGPYVMTMKADAPNWAKKTGSLLLLPVSTWGKGSDRRNPFIQEKRTWPIVEEDASQTKSVTQIKLPDGYTVEDIPEDVHQSLALQSYDRTITKSADGKTLTITETSVQKPGSVPSTDYAKVKAYYDSLIKTADDQIVLKKMR